MPVVGRRHAHLAVCDCLGHVSWSGVEGGGSSGSQSSGRTSSSICTEPCQETDLESDVSLSLSLLPCFFPHFREYTFSQSARSQRDSESHFFPFPTPPAAFPPAPFFSPAPPPPFDLPFPINSKWPAFSANMRSVCAVRPLVSFLFILACFCSLALRGFICREPFFVTPLPLWCVEEFFLPEAAAAVGGLVGLMAPWAIVADGGVCGRRSVAGVG